MGVVVFIPELQSLSWRLLKVGFIPNYLLLKHECKFDARIEAVT